MWVMRLHKHKAITLKIALTNRIINRKYVKIKYPIKDFRGS